MNLRDLIPFDLGSGTFLGAGTADRNVNLNDSYITPQIKNPDYDKENPYGFAENEMIRTIGGKPRVIDANAPQGFRRWGAGMRDRWTDDSGLSSLWSSGTAPDHDMRGTPDRWGNYPTEGVGRLATPVSPYIDNHNYPGDPNNPNAQPVPNVNQSKWIRDQIAITEWNRARSRADMRYHTNLTSNLLKDANYYAYELDKAQMYDYMNSPRGQAETALTHQQAMATPRLAKAALIEARAKSQQAANEFGQLGLQRTYTPGIG